MKPITNEQLAAMWAEYDRRGTCTCPHCGAKSEPWAGFWICVCGAQAWCEKAMSYTHTPLERIPYGRLRAAYDALFLACTEAGMEDATDQAGRILGEPRRACCACGGTGVQRDYVEAPMREMSHGGGEL